ncbi:MAG: DUF1587 domain-containing protein, partial [Steroidobacteraceae bacterium]
MIKKLLLAPLLAAAFAPGLRAAAPAAAAPADAKTAALLETYCQDCHNSTDWAGSLALDTMDLKEIPADAKVWETVVRKLRGRMMPPPTKEQPSQANVDQLVSFFETRIDAHAAEHPAPGFVSLHRLNRTEYERAVSDILAVKFDASALLPKDVRNEGFDNVANILKVSPSFLDQYLWAAREVSVMAVGDAKTARAGTTYRPGPEDSRMYVPGMPLGTRGGVIATHVFPVDGEYTFNIGAAGGGRGGPGGFGGPPAEPVANILLIDGVPVWDSERAAPEARNGRGIKIKVQAGAHKVVLASPANALTESDDQLRALSPMGGGFRAPGTALEIIAPASATAGGLPDTPSRQKIFICKPASAAKESPCARRIFGKIAREAFRRPVADED